MTRISSEQEARAILAHYHDALYGCVTSAWAKWDSGLRRSVALPSRRYAANAMYELMVDAARSQLAPMPGVNIIEAGQRFMVGIQGLVLSFKKVNYALETANYPTQTALAFNAQMDLPNIPEGTRLVVGYRPDRFLSHLLDVVIVAPTERGVAWSYSLTPVAAPVAQIQFPAQAQPTAEPGRRVRAKATPARKNDKVEQHD